MTGNATAAASPPKLDPRLYQISVLAALLVYGMLRLDFEISAGRAAVTLAAALLTQSPAPGSGSCRRSIRGAP